MKYLKIDDVHKSIFKILMYSDNAKEIIEACSELTLRHDTSVAHQPQTNGISEASIKRVKEGRSCQLMHCGLNYRYWNEAGQCFTFLHNVTYIIKDGPKRGYNSI